MNRTAQLAAWSALHDGITPSAVVRGWLAGVRLLARPLVRLGVPPTAVTAAGVGLSAGAVLAPPRTGAALVGLAALADGLDGGVAVLSGRASASGARLDRVADRCSEGLWLVALRRAGCPRPLILGAGAGVLALEGLRAALDRPAVVTVGERPNRVILVAAGLGLRRPAGAALGLALVSAVGIGQLLRLACAGGAAAQR